MDEQQKIAGINYTYFPAGHKVTVDNYPYGRLRCTAFFSVEFKDGKGFRHIFQTINPKNGRLNAEKKSTYYDVILLRQNEAGYVDWITADFNGSEAINKSVPFMQKHFDLFTKEQMQSIYRTCFTYLRAHGVALCQYCGADWEKVKPLMEPMVKACAKGIATAENVWAEILLPIEQLEALKVPDFNPFVKTTVRIPLSSLMNGNK